MDEPPIIMSAMANRVDAAAEVEVLLRSDIFVSDGRIHVVVVDGVMGPLWVSSRIYRVRDATNEPPSVATGAAKKLKLVPICSYITAQKISRSKSRTRRSHSAFQLD
jgi:hypothetical protein